MFRPLNLRIQLASGARIGPGKVRLLELVEETGSISAAGRAMKMSYRRAWLLVESLNEKFDHTIVETRKGGSSGGGAQLTDAGRAIIQHYHSMESKAARACDGELEALEQLAGHKKS